jgi:hypothetical protein
MQSTISQIHHRYNDIHMESRISDFRTLEMKQRRGAGEGNRE